MEQKYKPGDIAYIVANSIFIREVMILKISGGFVTLRFMEGGGAARLRESRLFPSREAAEECVAKNKQAKSGTPQIHTGRSSGDATPNTAERQ